MPEHTVPRSGQLGKSNPDVKASPASQTAFLPPGEGVPAPTASSPGADQEINLASESVAGEEDPGASLDMPAGASSSSSSSSYFSPGASPGSGGAPAVPDLPDPVQETPAATPFPGEKTCRECGGSGQFGASACPRCNGSGKVAVRQGGA